jgi:hypothetical protein
MSRISSLKPREERMSMKKGNREKESRLGNEENLGMM